MAGWSVERGEAIVRGWNLKILAWIGVTSCIVNKAVKLYLLFLGLSLWAGHGESNIRAGCIMSYPVAMNEKIFFMTTGIA